MVDKYAAFQLLDDEWSKIAVDLEIIQTEGFGATKKVDPNMVLKKKDNKEQEVQDGWIGRVLPFSLVQDNILVQESTALKKQEARLAEIPAEIEAILEEMSEDDKNSCEAALNDDATAFVAKEIPKKIKELKLEDQSVEIRELIAKLTQANHLLKEEKELKASIKTASTALHLLTKETIESLTDEQVKDLLHKKWIDSLMVNLNKMPETLVDDLVSKLTALQKKYALTYADIDAEIDETEQQLCAMLDELTGSTFDMKGINEFKALLQGE